jgi:hypothetical protein
MGLIFKIYRDVLKVGYTFQNKSYKETKQNKVFSEQKQQRYKGNKRKFGLLCTFVAFVLKKLYFALFLCNFCSEKCNLLLKHPDKS